MNKSSSSSTVSYVPCLVLLTTIVYTLCLQSFAHGFVVTPVADITKRNNKRNTFSKKNLSRSNNNNNNDTNNDIDETNNSKNRSFILQNRNQFLKVSIVGLSSSIFFVSQPQSVLAIDETTTTTTSNTNKIINTKTNKRIISQTDEIAIMAAYRRVKNTLKKLQSTEVEFFVTNNDYTSIKELVRVIPFSEIRSSCSKLIKYTTPLLDDTLSTVSSPLEVSYKKFILSLEKFDSTSSLGIRGRKIESSEFYKLYQDIIVSLQEFIVVTEKELFV